MFFHKTSKKIISAILVAGMALSHSIATVEAASMTLTYNGADHVYEAEPIHLVVDGKELTDLPMPPIILYDTTLVPTREVFEAMGAVVDWKSESSEIYVGYGDSLIVLQIDNPYANVDGRYMEMSIPPRIINGKTMIPVRFTAESLGFQVDWERVERIVKINKSLIPTQVGAESNQDPIISEAEASGSQNEASNTGYSNSEETISLLPNPGDTQSQSELAKDVSLSDIPVASYPETKIKKLTMPGEDSSGSFMIEAESAISRVDKLLLPDNRLVLDIYNAECGLEQQYIPSGNVAIGRIRAAQNQVIPVKITRVVFELTASVNYIVSISADRKTVSVTFEKNTVTDIKFQSDGNNDYLYITFKKTPGVNIYPMTDPDRIMVDLPMCDLASVYDQAVSGQFASAIRSSRSNDDVGYIVIELKEMAAYDVTYEANTAKIRLSSVTYKNITYDQPSRTIRIKKSASFRIDAGSIVHADDYLSYRYTFTLPGNYEALLGYGEYVIKDEFFNSVQIVNIGDSTAIVINEKQILAYDVSEDNDYLYFRAMKPKEKYQRIVIIDAGHGAEDNGASGNGLKEKDLTLDIVKRLMQLIEQDGTMKAYATRLTDVKPSRPERADFANNLGDIFVSIHINSSAHSQLPNGTEVYYYPHSNDATIGLSSEKLAGVMQKNLLTELNSLDRKVKTEAYDVLTLTKIPAVLCEIGFISNPEEAAKMADGDYRQKAANAIYKGLLETFVVYKPVR